MYSAEINKWIAGTLNLPTYLQPWSPHRADWVVVLRPTWHKKGHFTDVPQANLLAWYGKTKPNTTKAHIHQSKESYNTKTKARFSHLLWHPAWKRRGPILLSALQICHLHKPRLHDTTRCQNGCKPVWQPDKCLYTRYNRLSIPLWNLFDNRLYRVHKWLRVWQPAVSCIQPVVKPVWQPVERTVLFVQHGSQTRLTGWMFVYTIQPVVKPVVSCKRGFDRHPLTSSSRIHTRPMPGESFEFCCSGTFYKSNGHPDIQQTVSNHWRKSIRSCNDNIYLKHVQPVDN